MVPVTSDKTLFQTYVKGPSFHPRASWEPYKNKNRAEISRKVSKIWIQKCCHMLATRDSGRIVSVAGASSFVSGRANLLFLSCSTASGIFWSNQKKPSYVSRQHKEAGPTSKLSFPSVVEESLVERNVVSWTMLLKIYKGLGVLYHDQVLVHLM